MTGRGIQMRALLLGALLAAGAAQALPGGPTPAPKALEELQEADMTPPAMRGIGVDEKLNEQVPLDLELLDEQGRQVTLGQLLPGDKPVLLSLVYYRCPLLCNLVLNGLAKSMRETAMDLGEDFHAVSVSIDPNDTPHQSLQRRRRHLQAIGLPESAPWNFATGREQDVRRLADALGFRYNYDPDTKQYAHAAVVMVLTPEGKVSRYLYGADFPAQDVKLALLEAGQGKVGTAFERVILSCFKYDPASKRYGFYIFGFIRLGGLVIFATVAGLLFLSWRREFKKGSAV